MFTRAVNRGRVLGTLSPSGRCLLKFARGMAQICKSCGETYGDDAALCSIDGQPLEPWTAGFARAMAQTLTAASGRGSHRDLVSRAGAVLPRPEPMPPAPDLIAGRILSGRYLLEAQI